MIPLRIMENVDLNMIDRDYFFIQGMIADSKILDEHRVKELLVKGSID
jgi:hypothetical protein